jgi:hypothetical protein
MTVPTNATCVPTALLLRFICGTQDIHKRLEKVIADFHGMDDAILYASCFDANAGIFEALLTEEDAVISDELNHASIIDGMTLRRGGMAALVCRQSCCPLVVVCHRGFPSRRHPAVQSAAQTIQTHGPC